MPHRLQAVTRAQGARVLGILPYSDSCLLVFCMVVRVPSFYLQFLAIIRIYGLGN